MELILWRHADAEDGKPDGERRLTDKGHKQAARMAKWLAARLPEEYVVLASPAVRAQQTALALVKDFKTVPDLGTASSAQDLLRACGWPRGGTVVAVGHQPTIGEVGRTAVDGRGRAVERQEGRDRLAFAARRRSARAPARLDFARPDLAGREARLNASAFARRLPYPATEHRRRGARTGRW